MTAFTIDGRDFRWVAQAAAKDKIRPVLRNVAVWVEERAILATDSYRAHMVGGTSPPNRKPDFLISPTNRKPFKGGGEIIFRAEFNRGTHQKTLTLKQTISDRVVTASTWTSDDDFPILAQIWPDHEDEHGSRVVLHPEQVVDVQVICAATTVLYRGSNFQPIIALNLGAGGVQLVAEIESARIEGCLGHVEHDKNVPFISFSAAFLSDALDASGAVRIWDTVRPALFVGPDRTALLMPVRT